MNKPLHNFISKCESCGREGLQNWKPSSGEYCNACNPAAKTKRANKAPKKSKGISADFLRTFCAGDSALYSELASLL